MHESTSPATWFLLFNEIQKGSVIEQQNGVKGDKRIEKFSSVLLTDLNVMVLHKHKTKVVDFLRGYTPLEESFVYTFLLL